MLSLIKKGCKKIVFLATIFLTIFSSQAFAFSTNNLTIVTEPHMVLAITKIAREYSTRHNTIVSVTFNSANELISEIDQGEPADIFISAHQNLITKLKQKGLVDVFNIGYFAQDKVVLTTSKNNSNINQLLALKKQNFNIKDYLSYISKNRKTLIIDHKGSSSGSIVGDYLSTLKSNVKVFKKISEDKTPILTIVKKNPDHFALLLASQVNQGENFVTLADLKDNNIYYQALVIAGDNMETAREFLRFLKTKSAKEILQNNGFITN